MDKSYFSLTAFPTSCRLPSEKAYKNWAFRLDQGLGNGDQRLQIDEIRHFLRVYQSSPGLKKLSFWRSVANRLDLWGDKDGTPSMGDFQAFANLCGGAANLVSTQKVKSFAFDYDPKKSTLDTANLEKVWTRTRQNWTVAQWAALYPNAKIRGKGKTLLELSQESFNGKSLAGAKVDRHGDLDVTSLGSDWLKNWAPSFIIRKNDDHPTSFQFFAKHSQLQLKVKHIPQAYRRVLHSLSTSSQEALGDTLFLNLRDPQVVGALESHPELEPLFFQLPVNHLGPGDPVDRSRSRVVLALDFKGAQLWFDEKRINDVKLNQKEAIPSLHASVKINPNQLDRVILIYTPLYTRSNRPQGKKSRGSVDAPKRGYYHQGDSESVYLILDQKGSLQEILGDSHYYLTRATPDQVKFHQKNKDITFSVGFMSHANQLAKKTSVEEEVRTGSLRARSRGHYYDIFPGLDEVAKGTALRIKPRVLPDVDGLTQIHTQIGKTIGYSSWGFNDGIRFRRLRTDRWEYNTDPLFDHLRRDQKGLLDRSFEIGLSYMYGSGNSHQFALNWIMPLPKMEGVMMFAGLGGLVQYYPDEKITDFNFHVEGSLAYGFGSYFPHATVGLNAPTLSYIAPETFGLSVGMELLFYPLSFRFDRGLFRVGGGLQLNLPKLVDKKSFRLGKEQWIEGLFALGLNLEF